MGNEGKDKPSHTLTREEVEQRYPGLKIIDATDEMIGKTSIFLRLRPRKPEYHDAADSAMVKRKDNE